MSQFLAPGPASAPTVRAPAGACDCHFHVFDWMDRFPYQDARGFTPTRAPFEEWAVTADTLGITRGVLVQPSPYGCDNALLLHMLRGRPHLRGVAAPPAGVDLAQLKQMHALGVRGVRVNHFLRDGRPSYSGGLDVQGVDSMLPMIATLGWHVELWINVAQDLPALLPRLAQWPAIPVVFDHMGCLDAPAAMKSAGFEAMLELLQSGRAWAKLSGIDRVCPDPTTYSDARPIFEALLGVRTDRLVWGTNWPHPHVTERMSDDGELLSLFNDWVTDEGIRYEILVANASRLYGFGTSTD